MLDLDPAKLLIIAVVGVVVLGPDKLPAAAKKVSSLLSDLRRLQASVQQQVQQQVDLPLMSELSGVLDDVARLRSTADPRQAVYRSIGLSKAGVPLDPATPVGSSVVDRETICPGEAQWLAARTQGSAPLVGHSDGGPADDPSLN
jgi:Tat protein translocase TatB subunit